ncbi:sensor histidine kinase [Massilia niastensis]|uniref:sensor histidine kinase n=1 Tax=Massilia niastensis TaxID=544911 RepID=UPI0003A5ADEE|nr:HAMP domain-containing sensor histidine kinase [Massilia niastensis]
MNANLTGHLSPDHPDLSPATRAMLALRAQVLEAWMANVRHAVLQARELTLPILANTLPAYFDTLAAMLTPGFAVHAHNALGSLASEHGGERARMTVYDSTAVIHELQIFRDTLFAELERGGMPLADEQRVLLSGQIDSTIRESANAFALVQAALREQYVAAVAHDLRTPLSTAQMAAQMIEHTSGDETVRRYAAKIVASTQRIDAMTREMLDRISFTKAGPFPLTIAPFDMADVAREVAQYAQSFHSLELELEVEPVAGWWCRESMRRAVENLVNNAIKYGSSDPIRLAVTTTPERVQVLVHNKGAPIAPEDSESIFQLYRRAGSHGPGEGWGVGLSFVRRVAEAHGGSVLMSSSAEEGTSFVVDVPVDARQFAGAPTAA